MYLTFFIWVDRKKNVLGITRKICILGDFGRYTASTLIIILLDCHHYFTINLFEGFNIFSLYGTEGLHKIK